jgi:CheY-like chemotaxis protein
MTIFIAEDNPADVYLLRIAFQDADHGDVELIVANDGEEALDLVANKGQFCQAPKPDLIVLDLNLPRNDGADVLRFIRQYDQYDGVPVVVLTSSDSPRDRESVVKLGANCYLTKPSDLEAFMGLGKTLLSYARHPGSSRGMAAH